MSDTEKQYNLNDLSDNWNQDQINQIRHVSYKTYCTYNDAIKKLENASWNSRFIINEYEKNKLINIIMRQTNYTRDKAIEKLYEYKGNIEDVIKEYLGIDTITKQEPVQSVNQTIFKEMRNFMDTTKLEKMYPEIPRIKDSVRKMLLNYK